jgi:AcrR family transcriptional regulator
MVELTRKQREIERRTAEILRVARPILIAEGFQGLSMDRVAAQMEYAKGTIYNHFPNKEEIVLALAVESMELRRSLFEQSSGIDGSARLRMMALGTACEFFTQHCTDDFVLEQWVRNQGIWDKSSEKSQNLIRQCEGRCMAIVAGIVRDAIDNHELTLPDTLSAEELVFGFWAINYGSQILTFTSPSLPSLGINNPANAIRIHCCTLLNGFNWQPHMSQQRYFQEMESLLEQLLPRYWEKKTEQKERITA